MEQILSIENLSIALPRGADRGFAVDGVTLQVARGEILCVVGESGSGKSVLASAAMGALAPGLRRTGGRLTFQGQDVTDLPEKAWQKIRGNRIAMIFQEPMAALNPAIPVGGQVAEVLELHGDLDRAGRAARVLALLAATHLPDPPRIAASFPHQLSGGQCQRVVIAMALAMNPALLIADEPTTALDVTVQAQILSVLRSLQERLGLGLVL
ncbi:MAG: ABC transporter ATP-binding protein, partial [Ferrovibrionaceae bacterium]